MTASFDHARHWYFLAIDGDLQNKLRAMLAKVGGGEAIVFEQQKVLQLVQAEGELRCSFVLRNQQFVAAYPLVLDGYGWPLRIHDTLTWPDGIHANLMAKCDGFDVCQTVRANPAWAGMRIIMLTAKGRDIERDKGLALGADDYITKPFSTREVVERVRQLLVTPRD